MTTNFTTPLDELEWALGDDNDGDKFNPYDTTGKCPRPLKSSWHHNERQVPPPRPTEHWFMLDELHSGTTIARAKSLEAAYECLKRLKKDGIRVCIRPMEITEESRQRDTSYRKWKAQMGYATF